MVDQIALGVEHSITELRVPSSFVGHTLRECDLRRRYGVTVLAVKRGEHLTVFPAPDFTFASGDLLAVIGENSSITRLAELK
jgi:trk system potassium uptake protein TrkA